MPAIPRIEFSNARFSARNLPISASSKRVYFVATMRFQSCRIDMFNPFLQLDLIDADAAARTIPGDSAWIPPDWLSVPGLPESLGLRM